ncbi:hypothetical protein [Candidatus Regiella insecticola]|uniref:hypothetical protein n=1 Tax=Candidatus Regiella insecticola TaxID=138073 RepID=UPI00159651FE|nr:hypothetical protein [Candidatus Regiella insecticola]
MFSISKHSGHSQQVKSDTTQTENITKFVSQIVCTTNTCDAPASLKTKVALVYLEPIKEYSDLSRIKLIIERSPPGMTRHFRQVAGDCLRKITTDDSDRLAMIVAKARVANGESCFTVGEELGIEILKEKLERISLDGPAWAEYINCKCAQTVSEKYGIEILKRELYNPSIDDRK